MELTGEVPLLQTSIEGARVWDLFPRDSQRGLAPANGYSTNLSLLKLDWTGVYSS